MKTYTGEAFRAPYCEALAKGDVEWECYLPEGSKWSSPDVTLPDFLSNVTYRFKPTPKRTVTVRLKNGDFFGLVAPEREAPEIGSDYFWIDSEGNPEPDKWAGGFSQKAQLANGNVFLTREDAQAMADFQRQQRLGDV